MLIEEASLIFMQRMKEVSPLNNCAVSSEKEEVLSEIFSVQCRTVTGCGRIQWGMRVCFLRELETGDGLQAG